MRRLLDSVGVPGFEYFGAGEAGRVTDALKAWPLLQAVSRQLSGERRGDPERSS